MKIEKLTAVLNANGFDQGFNAHLADSSNSAMTRKIRSRSPGMEVFVRFEHNDGESVALLFFGGECESCASGEGRYERTGAIQDITVTDMGLALILKDAVHHYTLNLDKAISLPQ
jgi:hypothetical protein